MITIDRFLQFLGQFTVPIPSSSEIRIEVQSGQEPAELDPELEARYIDEDAVPPMVTMVVMKVLGVK